MEEVGEFQSKVVLDGFPVPCTRHHIKPWLPGWATRPHVVEGRSFQPPSTSHTLRQATARFSLTSSHTYSGTAKSSLAVSHTTSRAIDWFLNQTRNPSGTWGEQPHGQPIAVDNSKPQQLPTRHRRRTTLFDTISSRNGRLPHQLRRPRQQESQAGDDKATMSSRTLLLYAPQCGCHTDSPQSSSSSAMCALRKPLLMRELWCKRRVLLSVHPSEKKATTTM